jgi:PD-(D/E)XK nuclease superfamily
MEASLFRNAVTAGLKKCPLTDVASAKARGLFKGWVDSFYPILDTHDILEVESEFEFPLLNPETEAPSRTFVEAGKIDGILRDKRTGVLKVLEHKTTSDSIEPESNYWGKLTMDTQISKYILSLRSRGIDANTVVYDVVRKPGYKLGNIPLLDEDGVKIVLDSNGERVRTKDGKKWRQTADADAGYVLQTRPETLEELSSRTLIEVCSRPEDYFAVREVGRTDSDLLEYMNDAWAQSQMILYFRKRNLWPRNPSACSAFGTCEFFDLCAGRATVDNIRYGPGVQHAELTMAEGEKQLLTNSRLSALRKCSRYHFLRYEQPTRRLGEADEALALGSGFHAAAEEFLRHFVINQ